jgi:predicted RNA-binding protein with PUA-like domain
MGVVQRGSRLSIQPVTREEFELVVALAARKASGAASEGRSGARKRS